MAFDLIQFYRSAALSSAQRLYHSAAGLVTCCDRESSVLMEVLDEMSEGLDYNGIAPEAMAPLYESAKLLAKSGLESALLVLVQLRASQLNQCAFCLALHLREAQAIRESADRINGVAAWRHASWYTLRERAALEWAEALTLIASKHLAEGALVRLKEHFTEREIVYLTLAVNTINAWNRVNIAFRKPAEAADAVFAKLHPMADVSRT